MTNDLFVKIVLGLISIISALVSAYVIPYLKSKNAYNEFAILNDFVIDMVRAANQLFTKEEWKEKKGYVLHHVNQYLEQHTSLGLTEDQVDAIIEGIVREIKVADKDIIGNIGSDN